MKLFEPLTLKFENGNWASDPELALIDIILEQNPELIKNSKMKLPRVYQTQYLADRIHPVLNK